MSTDTTAFVDLRRVERRHLATLFTWGLVSVALGVPGQWLGGPAVAAVGMQFWIWGAIDAALAGWGLVAARRRVLAPIDPAEETRRIAKAVGSLRFNGLLDVLYVSIGIGLLIWAALTSDPAGRAVLLGHGVGVVVQGGFLLGFDHAFRRALARKRD